MICGVEDEEDIIVHMICVVGSHDLWVEEEDVCGVGSHDLWCRSHDFLYESCDMLVLLIQITVLRQIADIEQLTIYVMFAWKSFERGQTYFSAGLFD